MGNVGNEDLRQRIREAVWANLDSQGVALFPGSHGRIPNFRGADSSAQSLRETKVYADAEVISVNPDSPQRCIREMVMRDGKTLVMGTPQLSQGFLILRNLSGKEVEASTLRGAVGLGQKVGWSPPKIDLKIVGSVAVAKTGARLGKGTGYFDLGYSILAELGLIDMNTPVITNVHPLQIVDDFAMDRHDVPVDFIITPEEVITTSQKYPKPLGVQWSMITDSLLRRHPILGCLHKSGTEGAKVDE